MALRRPLAVIAGLFRELPAGDAVPIEAGGTGKTTLADAQAALGDLSAIAETTLNGTEQVPVWKGGFLKTTVAKICAWIIAQSNTWTGAQTFKGGMKAESTGTGTFAMSLQVTNLEPTANVSAGILRVNAGNATAYNHALVVAAPTGDNIVLGTPGTILAASYAQIRGGVQLGDLSPTFKVKVIDTTMAATVGDVKTVAHGVGAMPIMVIPRVTDTGGVAVHPNSIFTNAQYGVSFDATNVYLRNATGASANIVSRPVSIVIFYTA